MADACFATIAGWRYVLPATSDPSRTFCVTAAAALSSEKHSVTSPDAALELSCTVGDEYVLGMKWSATHAPYQPLSSAYRMSESTRSHGCDWLGQTENRTSVSIRTMFQRHSKLRVVSLIGS